MNATVSNRPPPWFWAAAVLGLLWQLFGVAMYLMHVGILPSSGGEMSQAERSLMESSPVWVTALFAIGVFAGALGALGLVLRARWARPLLLLSLVAVILQFAGWLAMTEAVAVIGVTVFVMPAIVVAVAVLLLWAASTALRRGWLR